MTRLLPLLLAACTLRSDLVIDQVNPGSGPSTQSTPVRIEGAGFRLPITSSVDTGDTVVGDVFVEVGGRPLDGAVWRSEQLIEGSVPAGLAIGSHDVTVRLGPHTSVLVDGFVVTDGTVGPGGDGGTACVFGPWGAPQPITELNTSGFEAMPRLSPDELTIYFHSQRAGGAGDRDVWTASRASTSVPFSTPTNVTQLNSATADRDPSPSGDGRTMLFTSQRSGNLDLYVARRAAASGAFSTPAPLSELNSAGTDYFGFLSADARTLYWSSTRDGTADIWYAQRPDMLTSFAAPQKRSEVSSTAGDFAPVLSADGRELYFSSSRSGDTDIWVSTRSDPTLPFDPPTRLDILSTPSNEDLAAWLSPDGQRLYLSSGVVSTTAAIYVATRPCL